MSHPRIMMVGAALVVGLGLSWAMFNLPKPAAPVPAGFVRVDPPKPLPAALAGRFGRPGVVAFWATWCTPCLAEMPSLARFNRAAEGKGIGLLTVLEEHESAKDAAVRIMGRNGLGEVPLVVDDDSSLGNTLGVFGIPTALVVNAKGEEIARLVGGADWARPEMLAQIEALIAQAATP